MKDKRKGYVSLTVKLNVLILAIIMILAGGLAAIAYQVNSKRVDKYFRQTTSEAAATVAAFADGDFVGRLLESIQSEDFQRTREAAVAAEDETPIRQWLTDHGLYEDFQKALEILRTYREKLGARFTYIQSVQGNKSINLLDPDEDLLYVGSFEISPEEFGEYNSNVSIEPTVSTTDFGWLCSAYEPVVDTNGTAVALVGVDIDMNDVMRERQEFLMNMLMYAALLMFISLLVSIYLMRRMATKPLSMLARATMGFAEGDRTLTKDDVIDLPIRSRDEIGDLYYEIRSMEGRMVEYLDNLTLITREKERIGAELNIATQIQADMLPRIFPAFPERHEFDIYATMTPAKEVGGDFYDFFLIDEDHLGMVMADVSGKGVPAALFMVIAKTLIKNRAQMGGTPGEILQHVNNQLCEGNEAEMFVTVWFAILEISTGKGLAANAGHEHPAIRRAGGEYELCIYRHSVALAVMDGVSYREHEFGLHPGNSQFVYTDGVPEATDANNELFGTDRMLEAMNEAPNAKPEELLRRIKEHIDEFVGDAPQFDDITMMGLQYLTGEKK